MTIDYEHKSLEWITLLLTRQDKKAPVKTSEVSLLSGNRRAAWITKSESYGGWHNSAQ